MTTTAPLILGVSGLRGSVGASLTPEFAARYAATVANWLDSKSLEGPVVIGRDGRAGSDTIYHAAIAGLTGAGRDVIPLDVAMTPTVAVAVDTLDAAAAVIVTASHNPQQWNGLKVLVRELPGGEHQAVAACAPAAADAAQLVERFNTSDPAYAAALDAGSLAPVFDGPATHIALVAEALADLTPGAFAEGMTVVVDAVNASGGTVANGLADFGARAIHIAADGSGIFPHTPEPTAENLAGTGGLCDAVPGLGAVAGFAQDPDADRLALVDEAGRYIGEEYTLVLCAEAVRGALGDQAAGTTICTNLSTSRMIEDVAKAYGAKVVRAAVGEANVVDAMKSHGAVIGGEGNGGVIWPETTYVRDSLAGMALVLALLARTGKTLSQLVADVNALAPGGQGYAIEKRKVDIPSRDAARPAVEAIAKAYAGETVDLQDGVRIAWANYAGTAGNAWLHVRASNTEPIMRLIAEASTDEHARAILDDATAVIAKG